MHFLTTAMHSVNIFVGLSVTMPRSVSYEVAINLDILVRENILQSPLRSSPIKRGT